MGCHLEVHEVLLNIVDHLYKSRSNWNHAFLFGIIFPCKGFHWTDWTGPDAEAMRVIFDLKGRDGATIFINLPPCWIPCCVARNGEEMLTFFKVWGWKSCSVYFRIIPLFMEIPCEQHFRNSWIYFLFYTFTHCVCVVDIGRVQFMGLFTDGIMMNRCHCLR